MSSDFDYNSNRFCQERAVRAFASGFLMCRQGLVYRSRKPKIHHPATMAAGRGHLRGAQALRRRQSPFP
jgi:hypothetical protein